ncbi:hypothetical protein N780_09590 [Pontibacillus chungwhensis BH030062]|uniref:Uncharacterized protein n=1 Tax=Pontibacillus chungwhensis BH030062 TaxID=1385513 RepID=A0A0A2UT38_9BACI|nr:hypothetical protein [Pontibacillus chungwhensis]KGP89883.1 hypothetical protein N780_09590 [Pontibacillus chungwhensis BH030062]
MRIWLIFFAIILLFVGTTSQVDAESYEYRTSISTWLWDTPTIMNEPDEVLQDLRAKHVQKLYLQVNRDVPKHYYKSFIKKADQQGIDVYALGGSTKWLKTGDQRLPLFKQWVIEFQTEANKTEQFDGFHLDIEPHAADAWDTDQHNMILRFQKIIADFKVLANELQLPLESDQPFWFDSVKYGNESFGKGILSEWLIQQVDGITLLAYRNFSEGNNGINKLIEKEMAYAEQVDRKVEVAIETKKTGLDYLSFYGFTQKDIDQVFAEVATRYEGSPSFNGFAVHRFESWRPFGSPTVNEKGWKLYKAKENVNKDYNWTVQFNTAIDPTYTKIYVENSEGIVVDTRVKMSSEHVLHVEAPVEGYQKGEDYTLYIEEIRSRAGKSMAGKLFMPFYVE